jgi:serine/threonine-protein kinase Chk1
LVPFSSLFSFLFFPLILGFSRDICDGLASPAAKRLKSNLDFYNTNPDDSHARMFSHSQPPPSLSTDDGNADLLTVEARIDYCFSQPTMLDDLLVSSQINATQGSGACGNPFQRLVKRMTRFFVSTKCDDTIKRLTALIERLGWTWKINDDSSVTISTVDRRKLQLIFKANLLEMDGQLLLDFRLSKGCGLDFKRNFLKIKGSKEISEIILNIPVNFSLATAVV